LSAAAKVGPGAPDRLAPANAPAIEVVDHRMLGTWSARGAEAVRQHTRSLLEVADEVAQRDDDILGLRPDAFLVRRSHLGTDRASGGPYERLFLMLCVFRTDGLVTRIEYFDPDRDDQALARFDELAAAPSRATRRPGRAVRPNAATANAAAIDAVFATRDPRALAEIDLLRSEGSEVVDHINGIVLDRRGSLASWRALLQVPGPPYPPGPPATLGDSLPVLPPTTSATRVRPGRVDRPAYQDQRI